MFLPLILLIFIVFFSHSLKQPSWINQVCSKYVRSECEQLFPIESAENDLIDLTAQSNDQNQVSV